MNMASNESYRITPKDIVSDRILFRIPLYQRLFTWGESQVRQLMDDLRFHFKNNNDKAYYLGMITVVRQGNRLDLIDGQQRTTVMMLLAIGFMRTLVESETKQNWNELFDSSKRVFFNGRSDDREFLLSLAEGRQSTYKNLNMEEGLSCVENYLNNHFNESELNQFANDVYNYLTLFVTELPGHYVENPTSLNEYFEAMNSSGKSLEQHEILKVELLRNYTKGNKLALTRLWNAVSNFEQPLIKLEDRDDARTFQCESYQKSISLCYNGNFEEASHYYYQQIGCDDTKIQIAEIEVKKYDFSIKQFHDKEEGVLSFPEFLLLVLALHTGKDEIARIHPTKLHDTFKNNPIPPDEIEEFYHELFMYRLLMDLYVVRIKYSSSSSTHTLIFNYQHEDEKAVYAHSRLKQFQSMLDVSTESHIWLMPFLKYLKSLDHHPSQMELLKFLMNMDLQRQGHSECPSFIELTYDSKPRYWLWRLDYALWEKLILEGKNAFPYENLETEAIRQYEFRNNRSIEHLHPQNESNNDSWEWEDVNSFGNLAMISNSFNSQQSNLPVHLKFANLEVQIGNKNLQSLKLYFMYLKAKRSEVEWTVEAKNVHSEEMLAILRESLEKASAFHP